MKYLQYKGIIYRIVGNLSELSDFGSVDIISRATCQPSGPAKTN